MLTVRIVNSGLKFVQSLVWGTDQRGRIVQTHESENEETAFIPENKLAFQLLLGGLKDYLIMWNKRTHFYELVLGSASRTLE
jgi:hypothetical protein